ncbi:uncharacterized protein LOC102701452 isoform X2 [Oryza brachyantha]|nr:uncharacterized protein LOC102701452 isoform X2 [Oryza brachyantha]
MQSGEVKMRFGRCPYCRAMVYQNPKAVIFYCSRCRTPIRGKNPEPTDETEQALSRLEILSADSASVFSDEPEDVGSDRRVVDEVRLPSSRRTRRPSSSSDWTSTTTDSERSEEAFYTPRNAQDGQSWQSPSPSPMSSQEVGGSGGGRPDEPGATAAARLMDPAFHKELLHALDNLRSLIITIEQPRPASGDASAVRAVTRRDSRLFRRLESQLERALPLEETASTSTSSSGRGGGGVERPAAPAQEGRDPCRPVLGGAPFVICGKCSELLRTPPPPPRRRRRTRTTWPSRIRCGGCQEVLELSLPTGAPAQHRPIRTCSAPGLVSDHHLPLPRRLE